MLSPHTQKLLDLKCEALSLTVADQNQFVTDAFESQRKSGLQGPDWAKSYIGTSHFDFFKNRVRSVHAGALEVIKVSDPTEDLDAIPVYMDEKIKPFAALMQQKLNAISSKPFSKKEPTIAAAYLSLKNGFDFQSGVAIKDQKRDKTMSKSYNVQGHNYGQVGDGNTQQNDVTTGDANMAATGAKIKIEQQPAEKTTMRRYLIYPLIVAIVGAVVAGIFALLRNQGP